MATEKRRSILLDNTPVPGDPPVVIDDPHCAPRWGRKRKLQNQTFWVEMATGLLFIVLLAGYVYYQNLQAASNNTIREIQLAIAVLERISRDLGEDALQEQRAALQGSSLWLHVSHMVRHTQEVASSVARTPIEVSHHKHRSDGPALQKCDDLPTALKDLKAQLVVLDNDKALEAPVLYVAHPDPKLPEVKIPSQLHTELKEASTHLQWHLQILATAVPAVGQIFEGVGGLQALQLSACNAAPLPDYGLLVNSSSIVDGTQNMLAEVEGILRQSAEDSKTHHLLRKMLEALSRGCGMGELGLNTTALPAQLLAARRLLEDNQRLLSPACARSLWMGLFEGQHWIYQISLDQPVDKFPLATRTALQS